MEKKISNNISIERQEKIDNIKIDLKNTGLPEELMTIVAELWSQPKATDEENEAAVESRPYNFTKEE